jgi:hypothetical protein
MADRGIKKVVIPKSTLPSVTLDNKYFVRYRIVSQDKNRVSAWSPTFELNAITPTPLLASNVTYSINNKLVNIAWIDPELRNNYDIFIKSDSGAYTYYGTVTGQSYSFLTNATTSIQFAIQISSISKEKSEILEIYESSVISLV